MKKILLISRLHFPISFIIFYLIIAQVGFCQDCKTQAANKPSASVRFPDVFVAAVSSERKPASWNITKMKPNLAKAESWVKNILAGFTGAKLAYSNDYFLDYEHGGVYTEGFYKVTSIKGFYQAGMRFYAYYCYDNNNNIYTEGESGSFIHVVFNNVFASGLCMDVGVFTINGKYTFKIFEKSRSEGRIDYYEQLAKSNVEDKFPSKNDFIIIRNSDKPVFIPITRKEYLEQLLKNVEDYKITEIASAKLDYTPANEAANKAKFDEELKRIDNSKNYTPEQMAPYRKRFIKTWETEKQKFDKRIARVETETTKSKEVLLEYLKKPQEWLGRSFGSFYSYSYTANGLKSFFDHLDIYTESKEDYTRSEVVSINPAYYNKMLGNDVPQLISVHVVKGSYPHMLKVAGLVKKPGALAPLEAILNPGKSPSPDIVLPDVTSTYTLNYLTKLTKLTPLTMPVVNDYDRKAPAATFSFEIPALSPKLSQLPQPLTAESYKTYTEQLFTDITNAVKPDEKKKADDYLKNKKLTQSKDISNTAFAAWLQNAQKASLYLYSKAVITNPSDALAANNFSAFLMMGGLPEKSIPILEFWNKQKPGEATLLCNLGNAYYRLGDVDRAMKFLQQCVQYDTLNPTANKILCLMYLKKGDVKKAEEHGTKSITTSYDEQVIAILRQLNNKIRPGEIMSRLNVKEFPLLKRTRLPALPSNLDDMEKFAIDFEAEKESYSSTIDAIKNKMPKVDEDIQQKLLMARLTKGMSPIQAKAQYIIMDAMQVYQKESVREADVFNYNFTKLVAPYNLKVKAISKKYTELLNKLEGGEAGGEDEIATLELAKCREINAEKGKYLAGLSPLVNGYAQRQEFISRKFYRDYANWAPNWVGATTVAFPSIEKDYLADIFNILTQYKMVMKSDCYAFEPLAKKNGVMKEWEYEYCPNFKGKFGIGPAKIFATCNSWGIEGGEGIVGGFEVNYAGDGAFKDVSFELGFGANWNLGTEHIAQIGAGASVKEFVKIGADNTTGKWEVTDAGAKGEIAIEGEIGNVNGEVKVIEVTAGYNSGVNKSGIVLPILNLK